MPCEIRIMYENISASYRYYFYHEKCFRFPVGCGVIRIPYGEPEITCQAEMTEELRQKEHEFQLYLNENYGKNSTDILCHISFSGVEGKSCADFMEGMSARLITRQLFSEPDGSFIEIICSGHVFRYAGKIAENGFEADRDTLELYRLLPLTEELQEEVQCLFKAWEAYEKSIRGKKEKPVFADAKKPREKAEILQYNRNQINIRRNEEIFSFGAELDGDNIIFTKDAKRLWPLGNQICTAEEIREFVSDTKEMIRSHYMYSRFHDQGMYYSDIDPEVYYQLVNVKRTFISSKTTVDVFFQKKAVRISGERMPEYFLANPYDMFWLSEEDSGLPEKSLTEAEENAVMNAVNADRQYTGRNIQKNEKPIIFLTK